MEQYGPKTHIGEWIHSTKHRAPGETFYDAMMRQAGALKDNEPHRVALKDIYLNQRFMGGGRTQLAVGSPLQITPYNCYVSGTIFDSSRGIMDKATEAFLTMRMGGGIGYDFSTLRPRGANIASQNAPASGAVSFMDIFDSVCGTVASAGNRRGAQMGVLRVDHPDIEEFIDAKNNSHRLTRFNMSIGITDEFMRAVVEDKPFVLKFKGRVYKKVSAVALWDKIMRSTWDWAEPGVLFIDRINEMNNLWYCEHIAATNPCGEQPLPPYGACLLGSFNIAAYIHTGNDNKLDVDINQLKKDIPHVVRAMDNIVDVATYPLPQQEKEAKDKRRMGLGVTGIANALEACGMPYGSEEYLEGHDVVMEAIRNECYRASVELAKEKGPFPLFEADKYCDSEFIKTLPKDIQDDIRQYGIRNSHLLSVAPTGTISLGADNVSSGIEPVFSHEYTRTVQTYEGPITEQVKDWAWNYHGVKGRTANELSVDDHLNVLIHAQKYVDSACSKTLNVGDDVTYEEFKETYIKAWEGGAKGCTTFRAAGKRYGILNEVAPPEKDEDEEIVGEACFIDPVTGQPECS